MSVKTFRLNIVVVYMTNPNNFQMPIQNIMRQMAWLYRFDYAIVDSGQVFHEAQNERCDLIYFRSTEQTRITYKKFQQLMKEMFAQASLYGYVDLFFQLQKYLKNYPFPDNFVRPLNYPYSDIYNDSYKTLYIDPDSIHELGDKD